VNKQENKMIKKLKEKMIVSSALIFMGVFSGVEEANAAGQNFNQIIANINASISNIPGLLSGVAYMMGVLLGILGILKIKDHVENPGQTPLQQGAIRLAAGGGLFALPIIYEAMRTTIGAGSTLVTAPTVSGITMTSQ
jgi:hypothetical protein